jgi:CMP-2-keto-3-deoxyoctulosonic acid synthetase
LLFKIMGTYLVARQNLLQLVNTSESTNQRKLSIEQLKIIENGLQLKGILVDSGYPSVNTTEDIALVEDFIKTSSWQRQIVKSYANF